MITAVCILLVLIGVVSMVIGIAGALLSPAHGDGLRGFIMFLVGLCLTCGAAAVIGGINA